MAARWNLPPGFRNASALTSGGAAEHERLRNHDTGTLLQLGEPLVTLASPDIAFVAMLQLEFVCFRIGNFDWLKVVEELDLLVEDLLFGIVSAEEVGF